MTYANAVKDAVEFNIDGVPVPFASPQVLWRMKQTVRAKDIPDRLYLEQLLEAQGVSAAESTSSKSSAHWWERLKALLREQKD